jgi:hydroxymethylglutaryl-CoA lyase
MDETVKMTDVTLRDGLQEQATVLSTADKIRVGALLAQAGYRSLEVTSFVRPDWVPQLKDAEELLQQFRPEGVERQALVPNRRGLERALRTDVESIILVVSASTLHNESNLNRTTAESLAEIPATARMARDAGMRVYGGIATAFGCPFRGAVTTDEVARVFDAYLESGVEHITLADTIGVATPDLMARVLDAMITRAGGSERIGLHLHDPGTGVSHLVDVALTLGVRAFEATLAGIGGCPFAPGAPGNARAEEIVPYIEQRGFRTGIDIERLPTIGLTLGMALGRGTLAPPRRTAHAAS